MSPGTAGLSRAPLGVTPKLRAGSNPEHNKGPQKTRGIWRPQQLVKGGEGHWGLATRVYRDEEPRDTSEGDLALEASVRSVGASAAVPGLCAKLLARACSAAQD